MTSEPTFVGFCDADGMACDESVATHEWINVRVAPGPKGITSVMRPRSR